MRWSDPSSLVLIPLLCLLAPPSQLLSLASHLRFSHCLCAGLVAVWSFCYRPSGRELFTERSSCLLREARWEWRQHKLFLRDNCHPWLLGPPTFWRPNVAVLCWHWPLLHVRFCSVSSALSCHEPPHPCDILMLLTNLKAVELLPTSVLILCFGAQLCSHRCHLIVIVRFFFYS